MEAADESGENEVFEFSPRLFRGRLRLRLQNSGGRYPYDLTNQNPSNASD